MRKNKYTFLLVMLVVSCFTISSIVPYLLMINNEDDTTIIILPETGRKFVPHVRGSRNTPANPSGDDVLSSAPESSSDTYSHAHGLSAPYSGFTSVGASVSNSGGLHLSSSAQLQSHGGGGEQYRNNRYKSKGSSSNGFNIGSISVPVFKFNSTSSMLAVNALADNAVAAADNVTTIRKFPGDSGEPYTEPIGDMPWVLMLMLVVGYILIHSRSKHISCRKD